MSYGIGNKSFPALLSRSRITRVKKPRAVSKSVIPTRFDRRSLENPFEDLLRTELSGSVVSERESCHRERRIAGDAVIIPLRHRCDASCSLPPWH